MVPHDVEYRAPGTTGVVQIGQAVPEPRPQMEQGRRRSAGHAGVPVGRPGGHALEKSEDTPHVDHFIEGGDEVHLGCSGVHEAGVDPAHYQCSDEGLGAVHEVETCDRASSKMVPGLRIPCGSNADLIRPIRASLVWSSNSAM